MMSVAVAAFLAFGCAKVLGFEDDTLAGQSGAAGTGFDNGGAAAGHAAGGHAQTAHGGRDAADGGSESGVGGGAGGAVFSQGGAHQGEAGEGDTGGVGVIAGGGASNFPSGGTGGQGGVMNSAGSGGAPCSGHPDMVLVRTSSGTNYCIDKTEVTRKQYKEFSIHPLAPSEVASCNWKGKFSDNEVAAGEFDLPAGYVDWCDAKAYCQWAGKRLCGKIGGGELDLQLIHIAEANTDEWFRVCSQAGASKYPYGKTYDASRCNFSNDQMSAVGKYDGCATPDGVVDLLGNVWEWENACDETATSDPQKVQCAHRGGSAFSGASVCSDNAWQVRSFTAPDLGFRCCSD